MTLKFKDGVVIKETSRHIQWALQVVDIIYMAHGLEATITSLNDGRHSTKSLHYKNLAFDIRLKDVPKGKRAVLSSQIARVLGQDYDVLYEYKDHPYNVHIHVEYDPD